MSVDVKFHGIPSGSRTNLENLVVKSLHPMQKMLTGDDRELCFHGLEITTKGTGESYPVMLWTNSPPAKWGGY